MANLKETELLSLVSQMEAEAETDRGTRSADNNELERRYNGELYGNEEEGRSSVISNDVKDIVEADMPGLVRTILGSGSVMKFKASNPSDEKQVEEAEEKTAYVDWIIRAQPNSFRINYGFLKDIEKFKMGVLKYFFEETETSEVVEFKGISEFEEEEILTDIMNKPFYSDFSIAKEMLNDDGTKDYKLKVTVKKQEVKIIGVPHDTFLISRGATDVDDAKLVGDTSLKTRGELLAEGFKRKLISQLPGRSISGSSIRSIDFDEDGNVQPSDFGEWANQCVEVSDLYVMIDYDQDGIAERRHIIKSGQFIIENEPFDHVPYAVASAVLTPHKVIGEGRAEQVTKVAEIKTVLTRNMLDNGYMANNPKLAVNDEVNIDDALSDTIGGVLRTKGQSNPNQHIGAFAVPFIGDKSLLLIQHMDQIKAQSVGTQLASQGLNADQLGKETATRFEGVRDASAAKLELVTRIVAEVGYRKLYSGVAWMVSRFQDTEREFAVLGKALTSNPKNWRYDHQLDSEIGLGASDGDKAVENLTGLWQMQTQLKAEQSPLYDEDKRFNTANKLVKALEFKNTSEFFNDPKEPDQQLKFENEQLNAVLLQTQQQMEILQQQAANPLAEAEMVKREGDLAVAQGKLQLEAAKLAEQQRQFNIQATQSAVKQQEETAVDLTELELKYSADVPGSVV